MRQMCLLFFFTLALVVLSIDNLLTDDYLPTQPFLLDTLPPTPSYMENCSWALTKQPYTSSERRQRASLYKNSRAASPACTFSQNVIPRCQLWTVGVVMLLQDSIQTTQWISQVTSFLEEITANCDAQSEILVFGGGFLNSSGISVPLDGSKNKLLAQVLSPDKVVVKNLTYSSTILVSHLNSLNNNAPNITGGRAALVYTDIPCHYYCDLDSNTIWESIENLTINNFITRINYLNDEGVGFECFDYAMIDAGCDTITCNAVMFGLANGSLHESVPDMMTCPKLPDKKGVNEGTLTIMISIPTLFFTVVIVILIVFLYKKFKIRQRIMSKFFAEHLAIKERSVHQKNNDYVDGLVSVRKSMQDEWEIERQNLRVHDNELLGNGAFAKVFKGALIGDIPLLKVDPKINLLLDTRNTEIEVAVKKLPAHADEQSRTDFMQEIEFMKNLGYHAHVISMLGFVSCSIEPMIVVEFCYNGDMLKFLRSQKTHVLMSDSEVCPIDAENCLKIRDLISLTWQISDGMSFMHSKDCVHRDLAARNVLLTKGMVAKIGDFGLCRYMDSALYTSKGGRLPVKWMAPESLKRYEFSAKSDVWSFSIVLFEVFSLGDGPFPIIQPLDLIEYLEEGNRMAQPERCPNQIYSLMELCWATDPGSRPCFEEIRSTLSTMLKTDDANYGYLDLKHQISQNISDTMKREVDDISLTTRIKDVEILERTTVLKQIEIPRIEVGHYDIDAASSLSSYRPTLTESDFSSFNISHSLTSLEPFRLSEIQYTCNVFQDDESRNSVSC